jgi:hypothetical protein
MRIVLLEALHSLTSRVPSEKVQVKDVAVASSSAPGPKRRSRNVRSNAAVGGWADISPVLTYEYAKLPRSGSLTTGPGARAPRRQSALRAEDGVTQRGIE